MVLMQKFEMCVIRCHFIPLLIPLHSSNPKEPSPPDIGGRGRERNINMREKHQLVASHTCLDWGLNLQPSASHLQFFTTNMENVGADAGDLRSKSGPGNGEEAPARETPLRKYLGAETRRRTSKAEQYMYEMTSKQPQGHSTQTQV